MVSEAVPRGRGGESHWRQHRKRGTESCRRKGHIPEIERGEWDLCQPDVPPIFVIFIFFCFRIYPDTWLMHQELDVSCKRFEEVGNRPESMILKVPKIGEVMGFDNIVEVA